MLIMLPRQDLQQVQPVHIDDLVDAVRRLAGPDADHCDGMDADGHRAAGPLSCEGKLYTAGAHRVTGWLVPVMLYGAALLDQRCPRTRNADESPAFLLLAPVLLQATSHCGAGLTRTFIVEHRIRSATGEYRWFLVRAEPYRDPDTGHIVRWYGTSTDVHDNRMAEAARRRSEAQYRALLTSIDEGFCIIDVIFDDAGVPVDFLFCEVNAMFEQQSGIGNVVGKTMRELSPQHETRWFEIYGKVAPIGEPVRFESEAKALQHWYDVYAFAPDEAYAGKVAILFKDISERKRQEDELRRADRSKDEFLAMLAHELRGLRLMVVDDNADAADMLAMLLEAAGHEVTVEHDSRRALERARIQTPDVFLLDIGLPDSDGIELARELRLQLASASSVLIAVTGYGQEQDRKSTAAAGFDYHFVKPVDTAELTLLLAEIRVSRTGIDT